MEDKSEKLSVVIPSKKSEKSSEKRSFWNINKEMLHYKLHWFLFVGGAGAVFPFHSAFGITILGLTASNIAACFTALQVSILVLKPVIGYIADYFNRLKAVIVGLAVLQAVFCFFMIIIPNTGMPGIHTVQLTNTSQNKTYCRLCLTSDKFEILHPKFHLNEENFRQISSCCNSNVIENILIDCSSECINSTNSNISSFTIRQTSCNLSFTNNLLSEKHPASEDQYIKIRDYSLDILYINTCQFFSICLLPVRRMLYLMNNSSDDLGQYCYALSNESNFELQELLQETDFTEVNCNDRHTNTSLQQNDAHNIGTANFKTYQFWAFAICLILACTIGSSEFTMSDTACYESNKGKDYGQQRAWGAIGWGLMAPLAGYLNDYTEGYMASWCVLVCLTALQICNLSKMNFAKPEFSQNVLKDMKTVFSSIEFLCFEAGVLLNGMFTGIIWYYLVWYIVSIGGNKLIIGLAHTVQNFFGEVPVLYFSGWLIKKLGHFNLVSLALISHGIRFFCYSYIHNPWWILPIECLHGFTFGSFYAAMTSYGKLNSKPGTEATTQSILCATYEALGCGLGCLITGVCLEYFGCHTTFFYASFVCIVATVVNIFSTLIVRYRKDSQDVTESSTRKECY